ncbi:hypothetical protein L9F63_015928, partial [Diploptera punctata]
VDVLGVWVSSVTVPLRVVYKAEIEPSLVNIIVNELKFVEHVQLKCLYHTGAGHTQLAGIMLHLDTLGPLSYQLYVSA